MEQKVTVDGKELNIHIEKVGDQGPALLMVHGIPRIAQVICFITFCFEITTRCRQLQISYLPLRV